MTSSECLEHQCIIRVSSRSRYVIPKNTIYTHYCCSFHGCRKIVRIYFSCFKTGFRDEDVYITGLCHDIGFLIYGELFRYPEFIQNLEYRVSSEGVLSFDIFYTVDRFDRNCQHVLISSKILEYMGIVPEYCSRAIPYHHSTTFPAHEDEKNSIDGQHNKAR